MRGGNPLLLALIFRNGDVFAELFLLSDHERADPLRLCGESLLFEVDGDTDPSRLLPPPLCGSRFLMFNFIADELEAKECKGEEEERKECNEALLEYKIKQEGGLCFGALDTIQERE